VTDAADIAPYVTEETTCFTAVAAGVAAGLDRGSPAICRLASEHKIALVPQAAIPAGRRPDPA
jgi:hypothetical protein